ncbi:hypothetical protein RDABS01_002363, partial [Bienertia sinuspersici]
MLEKIAGKCMSINLKDYVMFSCVCRSWHEAATVVKSNNIILPWLMLSNDDGDKRNLFDLSIKKCYNLSLPETRNRNCYGTGSGWILTVGLDLEIHLFNPLTRDLLHDLPPPTRGVVVIYGESDFVAAATPEDTEWTPIIDAIDVGDVAYCPTLGLTLFVQGSGFVSYCDLYQLLLSNNKSPLRLVDYASPSKQISKLGNPKICRSILEKFYLLESFGDILMVKRSYDKDTVMTDGFEVYKLDLQTKQWEEVVDLGDVVLFVGNSPATSVKASCFPSSCNPNSIYFTDDGREACYWYNEFGNMIDIVQG